MKTYNQPESSTSITPCTSKPCEWNKPRNRKLSPKQINQIRPVKHQYGKKPRLPAVPSSGEYNACSSLQNSFSSLSSKYMPIKLPLADDSTREMEIPVNISEDARQFFNDSVKVDLESAFKIESSTRSHTWFNHRQYRLTASNFGKVLKRKKQDCSKLVNAMITNAPKNLNVSSLRYGCENEAPVANYYVQLQERNGHAGIQVFPCGLVVNPKYSWLGASPDRIVFDPTSNPPYGCLEIKCIESGKGMTPLQTYHAKREPISGQKKPFCLIKQNDSLILNPDHSYFHQVQGQCAVSGLKWNDFVLMTDLELGDEGIHIERIFFDENWHNSSLIKLTHFYFSQVMPTLLHRF